MDNLFGAVKYHAAHIEHYKGFFTSEVESSECIRNLATMMLDEETYEKLHIYITFVSEFYDRITHLIKALQERKKPTAHCVFNYLETLDAYLDEGVTKETLTLEIRSLFEQYHVDESQADAYIHSSTKPSRLQVKS